MYVILLLSSLLKNTLKIKYEKTKHNFNIKLFFLGPIGLITFVVYWLIKIIFI